MLWTSIESTYYTDDFNEDGGESWYSKEDVEEQADVIRLTVDGEWRKSEKEGDGAYSTDDGIEDDGECWELGFKRRCGQWSKLKEGDYEADDMVKKLEDLKDDNEKKFSSGPACEKCKNGFVNWRLLKSHLKQFKNI